MSNVLRCSICRATTGVLHFGLTLRGTMENGQRTRRGAGRIDLCERCWANVDRDAAQRRRPFLGPSDGIGNGAALGSADVRRSR